MHTDKEIIIMQDMLLTAIFDYERLKAKTKDRICEMSRLVREHVADQEIEITGNVKIEIPNDLS